MANIRTGIIREARRVNKVAGRSRGMTVGKINEQGTFNYVLFEHPETLKVGDIVEYEVRGKKAKILNKVGVLQY